MIYISLGSNIGNRLENLRKAIYFITQHCPYDLQVSIVIETEALLLEDSPSSWNMPFLNMIIGGKSKLNPVELLHTLKVIEKEMGRSESKARWAPRIIDLDILLYDDIVIDDDKLKIPHPELNNRNFLQHLLALMGVEPWCYAKKILNQSNKAFILKPKLVGIVNITQGSFSDGGKFYDIENAIKQITQLENAGASVIELGAESTRPGAILQSSESEYKKLVQVLDEIPSAITNNVKLSIDTFHPSIALKLIRNYKIDIINDVKGNFDDEALKEIAEHGCKFCAVHSLTIPPNTKDVIPDNIDPIKYLLQWGKGVLEHLSKIGFSDKKIILDPGIGFGKTAYQNLKIIKNISQFKKLKCEVMLGHSRKSYIQTFSSSVKPQDRDMETIGISLAVYKKVDFLRVHNISSHMRALVAHSLIEEKQ